MSEAYDPNTAREESRPDAQSRPFAAQGMSDGAAEAAEAPMPPAAETGVPAAPSPFVTDLPDVRDNVPFDGPSPDESVPSGDATSDASDEDEADDDPTILKTPFPLPDLRDGVHADGEDQSREEFTTVYDIIDRMEEELANAKGGIFTPGQVKVDRDSFANDIEELKKMLPVQLERASALMREAERRLESAQTQANAIVASAQSQAADIVKEANEQAQFLAGQENVTELARQKARAILNAAQAKADHLTHGADDYSTKVMESLRAQLAKMTGDVDAGLNVLYERRKEAARDLPHLNQDDYPESR